MVDFKYIENKYNVETIKFNGIEAWPILRIYLASKLILNKNRVTVNKGNIFSLLKSFFLGFYNLLIFKNGYLAFSDSGRRVLIDGVYYDRLVDPIAEKLKLLVFETPLFEHFPKSKTKTKYLSSSLPFFLLQEIISYFIILRIENESLIKTILFDANISIDYKKILKKVIAQSIVMGLIIRFKKIKGVFLVVSYTKEGIIIACKRNNIPVVELQHGVINEAHYAYNINKRYSDIFFPDYILTYGESEKKVFESNNNNFIKKENVFVVGNYLIDYYRKSKLNYSEFEQKTSNFKFTISITGQNAFDHILAPFIIDLSIILPYVGFIYIPRDKNYFIENNINLPPNIVFINTLNTYDVIRRSTMHCTITSTCGIEALCLGIPNIFINIDGWSKKYYAYLMDYPYNFFADTVNDFISIVNNKPIYDKFDVIKTYSHIIKDNYLQNLNNFINIMKQI